MQIYYVQQPIAFNAIHSSYSYKIFLMQHIELVNVIYIVVTTLKHVHFHD